MVKMTKNSENINFYHILVIYYTGLVLTNCTSDIFFIEMLQY